VRLRERFADQPLSDDDLRDCFVSWIGSVDEDGRRRRFNARMTWFTILTVAPIVVYFIGELLIQHGS